MQFNLLRRREFLTLVGGAAAAWPTSGRAQQVPVIGYLDAGSPNKFSYNRESFRQGLGQTGFVEGRNVAIEYRYADGRYERLPALAADLVGRRVTVIVTGGSTQSAVAAKALTSTIPIIFGSAGDPVVDGLVASLNRPGGNLTGVSNLSTDILPKKLELLHELVPAASTIAVLFQPSNQTSSFEGRTLASLQPAAEKLGVRLQAVHAGGEGDLDAAFASLGKSPATPLLIAPNALFLDRRDELGVLAARYAIPAIYSYREFTAAGGLASYGGNLAETSRIMGVYTGRVLKGEKPANLPVQQQTKLNLVINLKTAKALELTVPQALLATADEVIE